jgi:serine/threonine-protein kinase
MADAGDELAAGSFLGTKYRIERRIGHGGMGAVYLAENVDIGRKVAIKVLHPDFASDDEILQRFRMEARATAAIGHPGIVDVLDLGTTDDGSEFIVMERLEGETLGARIARSGRLHPDEAIPIACEVLDALGAAHRRGVVHRDLKPENVFLCTRPVRATKILDFGISKFSGTDDVSLTRTGTVMGSPLYMSPEQARGAREVGPASDLYSIGAILYEALSGKPPFGGQTYNEVIANVLVEPLVPLVEANRDIPPEISDVVGQLLARTAADRPPDAAAAKLALRRAHEPGITDVDVPTMRASDARPIVAPDGPRASLPPSAATRPSPGPPTGVVRARRRSIALVVLLGALVGAAGAGVAVVHRSRTRALPAPVPAPAPVAVAVPAPVPAPAPAPPVELRLTADPPAARWFLDGVALGCNPCTVAREAGARHVASARADGYAEGRLELVFDRARDERLPLAALKKTTRRPHPVGAAPSPPAPSRSTMTIDSSNPFK